MIDIDKIEDGWLADINTNLKTALGLKTVATYESEFDLKTLQQMILLTPFALIHYGGLPTPLDRAVNRQVIKAQEVFLVYLGAQTLRDRKDVQRGCYTMIKAFRNRYDGNSVAISGGGNSPTFGLEFIRPTLSEGGLVVYLMEFSIVQ